MGLSIDISHIKNKEIDASHRLKAILDNIPEAVYWIDRDSIILGCNKVEANLFDFESPEQMIGKNIFDFAKRLDWKSGIAEKLRENDINIIKTEKGQVLEEEYISPNGELKYFLTHKIPYRNKNNEVAGIVGISVDITERKALEAEAKKSKEIAEAASQAKTVLLNNFRHDTRTPMYGISGSAEILLHGIQSHVNGEPVDFQELLIHAHNTLDASNSLCQMLEEITETVHLYDGKASLQHRKFSLHDQINYIMKLNIPSTMKKNLQFTVDYDNNIPIYLIGDDTVIRRIIQELTVNAIKFTERGYVRLTVQSLKIENKIATIQITVSDSGLGIPEEEQTNVFHYFQRLSPAQEGRYKGLGTGLFRVKNYLNSLNGEIALESKPNIGTTISLCIPFKIAATQDDLDISRVNGVTQPVDESRPINKPMQTSGITTPTARVLVVEDNPTAALVTRSMLKNLNCQTDLATDGKTAVALATLQQYAFILMDVGLPDFSGIEATRQIRSLQTKIGQNTPIVALTAHAEGEEKQACLDAGMNAVLAKPLSSKTAEVVLSAFIQTK